MQLLGSRDGGGGDEAGGYSREPAAQGAPARAPARSGGAGGAGGAPGTGKAPNFDDMDDDIPF